MSRTGSLTVVLVASLLPWPLRAQNPTPQPPMSQEETREEKTAAANLKCLEPIPMLSWDDYRGPLAKTAGILARKLERKSTTPPRYRTDAMLCTLGVKDKFLLFAHDTVEPFSFLSAAFNAGLGQAQNQDPSFGQGSAGYGKRFASNFAGQTTGLFFGEFLYPTLFKEDPRYYRLARGSTRQRLLHALEHAVIAHRDDGKRMFHFSEWLGTTSTVILNNTYHPGNNRSAGAVAEAVGTNVATDTGFDVLREFWPEIAHKFKLPFRERPR
jgi:hypothetical protein